jgi:hypothetical protein
VTLSRIRLGVVVSLRILGMAACVFPLGLSPWAVALTGL